ncbi:hypothetical protein JCM5353_004130 [Sporobolomyces roseus]
MRLPRLTTVGTPLTPNLESRTKLNERFVDSFPPLSPRSPYTFDYGRRSSCSTTVSSPRSPLFSSSASDGGGALGWNEEEDEEEIIRNHRIPASIATAFFDKRPTVNLDYSLSGGASGKSNEVIHQAGSEYTFPPKLERTNSQTNLRPVLETRESTSTASTSSYNVNEPRSHFSDWGTSIAPTDSMVSLSLQIPSNPTTSSGDLSHLLPISSTLRSSAAQDIWKSRSTTHLHIAPFPPHPLNHFNPALPSSADSTPEPEPRLSSSNFRNSQRRRSVPANIWSPLRRDLACESGVESPFTTNSIIYSVK